MNRDAAHARLEALLTTWFERLESGESPDLAEHCVEHPELRPRLERLLERETEVTERLSTEPAENAESLSSRLPAETLGGFQLLSLIGSGGMGQVYLARQESLGRLVALKVLRPSAAADDTTRLRFRREAEITAALDHPNIVPVYATGEDGGLVFLAMKLLDGPVLANLESPLAPRAAAAHGAAVARALHAAHAVGIVHRDVKPANVMLDDGVPYILDFGLARNLSDRTVTREGSAPGTLPYMAPEQLQGGVPALDPRVDIYGLGATLYEAVSGRPPFPDETPEALLRRILVQDPPPLALPARDRDLEIILQRAMDKEPARRFPSALELAQDLERYQEGLPIQSRPASLIHRYVRLARRHRTTTMVASIALVATLVLGGLLIASQARARRNVRLRMDEARAALDRGDFIGGRRVLAALEREHGAQPTILSLRRRAADLETLETLLDHLQAPFKSQDPATVRELITALKSASSGVPRTERAQIALAAADLAGHDLLACRERLDRLPAPSSYPRAVAALCALARKEDPGQALLDLAATPAPLPGSSANLGDDHVLVALALRAAGRPRTEQHRELYAAWKDDERCYRAVYGLATLMQDEGDFARAFSTLMSLTQHPAHRPVVFADLARVAMVLGDVAEAERLLKRALAERAAIGASDTWLPGTLVRLQLRMRKGQHREFQDDLEAARARWSDHPWLEMFAGHAAVLNGEVATARTHFTRAIEIDPRLRRHGGLALLHLDMQERPYWGQWEPLSTRGPGERAELERIIAEGEALAALARDEEDPIARCEALIVTARCRRLLGDREAAGRDLIAALEAAPRSIAANLAYATIVVGGLLGGEPSGGPGLQGATSCAMLASEAIRRAGLVIDRDLSGRIAATPRQIESAQVAIAVLANELGRSERASEAAQAALELMAARGDLRSPLVIHLRRLIAEHRESNEAR